MSATAKRKLKPYVAAWLDELTSCYERREVWNPILGRTMEQSVLAHPPPAEHTGRLHGLIEADYSPLVSNSKIDEYMQCLQASGKRVPLERANFPAGYYWTIIKKWDRWKKLRVIARIKQYAMDVKNLWEEHWQLHGGEKSPYTREWIRHDNLVNAHQYVYGVCGMEQRKLLDRKYPAVAVMRRIETGGASSLADIDVLERLSSPWCEQHVKPRHDALIKSLAILQLNEDKKQALRTDSGALYSAVLAQDIEARHQRALTIVKSWNNAWGQHIAGYLETLGNTAYIRLLREEMPLRRVGDPEWKQSLRTKKAKQASNKRTLRG